MAVIPGAPVTDGWRELARGKGWIHYLVATLTMELHRKEAEAYRVNLSGTRPIVFVVLAETDDESES